MYRALVDAFPWTLVFLTFRHYKERAPCKVGNSMVKGNFLKWMYKWKLRLPSALKILSIINSPLNEITPAKLNWTVNCTAHFQIMPVQNSYTAYVTRMEQFGDKIFRSVTYRYGQYHSKGKLFEMNVKLEIKTTKCPQNIINY